MRTQMEYFFLMTMSVNNNEKQEQCFLPLESLHFPGQKVNTAYHLKSLCPSLLWVAINTTSNCHNTPDQLGQLADS